MPICLMAVRAHVVAMPDCLPWCKCELSVNHSTSAANAVASPSSRSLSAAASATHRRTWRSCSSRTCRTLRPSSELDHIRSRWCAPPCTVSESTDEDRLDRTPPELHGSRSPLVKTMLDAPEGPEPKPEVEGIQLGRGSTPNLRRHRSAIQSSGEGRSQNIVVLASSSKYVSCGNLSEQNCQSHKPSNSKSAGSSRHVAWPEALYNTPTAAAIPRSRAMARGEAAGVPGGGAAAEEPEGGPTAGVPKGGPAEDVPEGGPAEGVPEGGPAQGVPEGGPAGLPGGVDSAAATKAAQAARIGHGGSRTVGSSVCW
mmetsp:Transcript_20044/g.62853  ORF Transcript_20044/g.62853 Transcript_20044/m.62853 type:complete len:312 (+) Transcript_20044:271-1206(+)